MDTQLEYGNWIRKKILLILGLCTLGIGALALIPLGSLYRISMAFLFVTAIVSFLNAAKTAQSMNQQPLASKEESLRRSKLQEINVWEEYRKKQDALHRAHETKRPK